jgi:holliday junction DNA helicase RuvB
VPVLDAAKFPRPGDLAAILTHLRTGDMFFIDEIHLMNQAIAQVLCGTMQDYRLDMVTGKGPGAKYISLPLPHFSVLAATTRPTLLSYQLRSLFPVEYRLDR